MRDFKEVLKELMQSRHVTNYRLTKDLSFTGHSTVTNWITGKNTPKVKDIIRLAQYFNVTTDYLLGLDDKSDAKYVNSFNGANISAGGDVKL